MSSTRLGSSSAPDAMIRSYSSTVIRWSGGVPEGGMRASVVSVQSSPWGCSAPFYPPFTVAALTTIVFEWPGPQARSRTVGRGPDARGTAAGSPVQRAEHTWDPFIFRGRLLADCPIGNVCVSRMT